VIQGKKLCLMDTQLVGDADPADVGAMLGNLAVCADRYERELFGTDQY
jgi:hypothetical protein